jgi:hypothetical protein
VNREEEREVPRAGDRIAHKSRSGGTRHRKKSDRARALREASAAPAPGPWRASLAESSVVEFSVVATMGRPPQDVSNGPHDFAGLIPGSDPAAIDGGPGRPLPPHESLPFIRPRRRLNAAVQVELGPGEDVRAERAPMPPDEGLDAGTKGPIARPGAAKRRAAIPPAAAKSPHSPRRLRQRQEIEGEMSVDGGSDVPLLHIQSMSSRDAIAAPEIRLGLPHLY